MKPPLFTWLIVNKVFDSFTITNIKVDNAELIRLHGTLFGIRDIYGYMINLCHCFDSFRPTIVLSINRLAISRAQITL